MEITIKWEASANNGTEKITLEDLGYTEKEWNEMGMEAQREIIVKFLGELDTCWPVLDYYEANP